MEIKRDYYLNKLINAQNNGLIKIVTGIRRCGKSYLLNNIFYNYLINNNVNKSHIITVSLDDVENEELLDPKALSKYLKDKVKDDKKYYIILDEVQLVPNFEAVLNGLLKINNVDIYVTGSNSRFLSSDIVTEFRGRGFEIRVYPLSFQEFYSVYDGEVSTAWEEYCKYGGLPLVALQNTIEAKIEYLNNQQKNAYLNDVIERNNIQNDKDLNTLVSIIASSVGSLTNPLKLAKSFNGYTKDSKISDKTIYSYLQYLEDAFLIEKVNRYDVKGKHYIDTPQKYYFTDIGIRNSLLNFRQMEENHLMENVIYLELRRRGFAVDIGVVETRERNEAGKQELKHLEIDFIANKGDKKYYIQSALAFHSEDKKLQELRPLLKVNDYFKKIIIVKNTMINRSIDENGIVTINLLDFLLDNDSLEK